MFSSHSQLFVESRRYINLPVPHLHLVPPLRITSFESSELFGIEELESLRYRVALFALSYTLSRFSRTPTCDRQTDIHTTTAYTAVAWRRAVQ